MITCKKCKKEFKIDDQEFFIKNTRKFIYCPECKMKYEIYKFSEGYIKTKSGFVREEPKTKMSKKERLKLRKQENKIDK